jgi:hypothetical protein
MENRFFKIFCISAFVAGVVFGVFNILRENKDQEEGYKRTFESAFNGVVSTIQSNHSTLTVTLTDKQQFIFVQSADSYLKGNMANIVGYGDEISKKAFSDDIIVKHNDKIYRFKMNRPSD